MTRPRSLILRMLPTVAAALFGVHLTAQHPADAGHERRHDQDIVATAIAAGSFETLVAAVKAADLVATLQGPGPFTVFAPSDEAFAKLGKDTITDLLKPENKAKLASILTYHVVAGNLPAAKVLVEKALITVQGSALPIAKQDGGAMAGTAKIVTTDIACKNGTIHVIDSVILPPADLVATAAKAGKFRTLLTAATAAGLADTLATGGPFTVFAPSDEAFAKLGKDTIADLLKPENKAKLADILKYHVVAGRVRAAQVVGLKSAKTLLGKDVTVHVADGKVMVGKANVTATDIEAGNGVVHVIDSVLLPE